MNNNKKLTIRKFLALGREQKYSTGNRLKKNLFSLIGILPINPRIRSGRTLSEIYGLNLPSDASVLDAGFGHGLTMFRLTQDYPNWHIWGYELEEQYVKNAQKIKQGGQFDRIYLEQINLEEMQDTSKYDLVYSCDVLEHVPDDMQVLENFENALKPGGILILHLPLRYEECKRIAPWFKNYTTSDHVRDEYLPQEITEKLARTGFEAIALQYGYGLFKGELSFELNNFINTNRYLLILSQVLTLPFALILGYLDIRYPPKSGNSLVIKARKKKK